MESIRIVPAEEVTQGDIDYIAYRMNLAAVREIDASDDAPHEIVFRSRTDAATLIHQVDDSMVDVRYLVVKSGDLAAVVAGIRELIPTVSLDDAETLFESGGAATEVQRAVAYFGLLAPPTDDERVRSLLERAFVHPERIVRRMAVLACGYAGWPELVTPLRELAQNDPDEDVRKDAEVMVEGYAMKARGELKD
jgi:hypothetical protein